jgi:hypothetical protein
MDEGSLSFVTGICCTYMDYPYKRELGGKMMEGPRLSRPREALLLLRRPLVLLARGHLRGLLAARRA